VNRARFATRTALAVTLLAGGLTFASTADPAAPAVEEDEAGWNCLTMGNGDCGPDWHPYGADVYVGDNLHDKVPQGYCVTDGAAIHCESGWTNESEEG
jgi:hypothetical protein